MSFLEPDRFTPEQDNQYLSSIVDVEAKWKLDNLFPWENQSTPVISSSGACAQPYALPNQPIPSIFVLAFPDGCPNGIKSMNDLLNAKGLANATMAVSEPVNGDFPIDPEAVLQSPQDTNTKTSANAIFIQAFYDWLRSNETLPKVDSIVGVWNQPLQDTQQSGNMSYIFVIELTTPAGNAAISKLALNPFADIRVNQNQLYAINSTPVTIDGMNWTVVCRDQVHCIGTANGGKHAGQPMPGDPVNWSDLRSYVTEAFANATASRKPKGITLEGTSSDNGGIVLAGSYLLCDNGKELPKHLRKSAYSGGLAVEVRISSPMSPNQGD